MLGSDLTVLLPDQSTKTIDKATMEGLEFVNLEVRVQHDDDIEIREYGGYLISAILAEFNFKFQDIAGVRFISSDGYVVEISAEILSATEAILATTYFDQPIRGSHQPYRAILPEQPQMYWPKAVVKMELLPITVATKLQEIFFFETLAQSSIFADSEILKIADLLSFLDTASDTFIHLIGADGLEKRELSTDIKTAYFELTGPDAPLFKGDDIHLGREVKNTVIVHNGTRALVFADTLLSYSQEFEVVDGNIGLSFPDFLAQLNFNLTADFCLNAADGYSVVIEASDDISGVLYFDANNSLRTAFSALLRQYNVRDLMSISTQ